VVPARGLTKDLQRAKNNYDFNENIADRNLRRAANSGVELVDELNGQAIEKASGYDLAETVEQLWYEY